MRLLNTMLAVSCCFLLTACMSQKRREDALRHDLVNVRSAVDQYVQAHKQRPVSFRDLIADGYLREVPVDPMTGRTDTWKIKIGRDPRSPNERPGILEIHSGSTHPGSDGRPYDSW